MAARRYQPESIRFWAKIAKSDACWLWTGALAKGYGEFKRGATMVRAHRLMWEFIKGPIPSGLGVLHTCDEPRCVNPDHLFLGTQKDNVTDMLAKGRQRRSAGACRNGHALRLGSRGQTYCQVCKADYQRRRRAIRRTLVVR